MPFVVFKCAGCSSVHHAEAHHVPILGSYCDRCVKLLETSLVLDCAVGTVNVRELAESMNVEIVARVEKIKAWAELAIQKGS